jgi:hypothetical protein
MDAAQAGDPVHVTDLSHPDSQLPNSAELAARYKEVDEYAIQSKLPILKDGDPDEIRFWVTWANFDVRTIGYDTEGYVISSRMYSVCRITYPPKTRSPFVGTCKPKAMSSAINGIWQDVAGLAKLSGQSLNCGGIDGAWIEIDGVFAGQRFIVAADNPHSCEDEGSKLVSRILDSVR